MLEQEILETSTWELWINLLSSITACWNKIYSQVKLITLQLYKVYFSPMLTWFDANPSHPHDIEVFFVKSDLDDIGTGLFLQQPLSP